MSLPSTTRAEQVAAIVIFLIVLAFIFILATSAAGFLAVAFVRVSAGTWLLPTYEPTRAFLYAGLPVGFFITGLYVWSIGRVLFGNVSRRTRRDD